MVLDEVDALEPDTLGSGSYGFVPVRWREWPSHVRSVGHSWVVSRRSSVERSSEEELSRHRSRKAAYTAAQLARFDCDANHVIQVAGWALGGWWVEVLPARHWSALPDDGNPSREAVWSPEGCLVGVIELRGRTWMVMTSTDGKTFQMGRKVTDSTAKTRAEAVATVHRLADDGLDDPTWPARWEQARDTLGHTVRGEVMVNIDYLGSAGVRCTYPDCTTEATRKLTLQGSDIAGERDRMCCEHHTDTIAVEIMKRPQRPGRDVD